MRPSKTHPVLPTLPHGFPARGYWTTGSWSHSPYVRDFMSLVSTLWASHDHSLRKRRHIPQERGSGRVSLKCQYSLRSECSRSGEYRPASGDCWCTNRCTGCQMIPFGIVLAFWVVGSLTIAQVILINNTLTLFLLTDSNLFSSKVITL